MKTFSQVVLSRIVGQGVCTLSLFSVLTEIFDLEEIHNDRSRLWAFSYP